MARDADPLLLPARELPRIVLAWQHDLRAYDAVQLATALTWRDEREDPEDEIVFAYYDLDLRRAVTAEELKMWPG